MQEELRSKYQFFQALIEINKKFRNNNEFVEQVKKELLSENIYPCTTTGERIELPINSTVIDFAYKLGSDSGDTFSHAIVNDKVVGADYILHNKDIVKIVTNPFDYGKRNEDNILDKVTTTKAKTKIKEFND